jgi:tellurite resistance protein TerA
MPELSRGANAAIESDAVKVVLDWAGSADADVSAYLLGENGKVGGDLDMVFYGQPAGGKNSVRLVQGAARGLFEVDLGKVPAETSRIVFCVTVTGVVSVLSGGRIEVQPGGEVITFAPPLDGATEAAMIFGELYRRAGAWKFRAVGQGFNGGLAPLARSFGVEVDSEEQAAPPPPSPPPAAPPVPPATPVNLGKVSLEKRGQSISLEKRGSSFGEIVVNLNWSRGKRGLFAAKPIDLDLGCLLEMADGQKSVVQALGRMFGSYDRPPYIQLDGDDRTGDVSRGETMRVNGAHWNEIRRIAIFANIYAGVPNWQETDGVVTVTMPNQPPIEVRMTEGRNNLGLCGVVLLENVGGTLKASRIVDYFRDQRELDEALGWGLRWVAGSKD